MVCLSPSSPASTGHVFTFSHSSASRFSSSGGSMSETNSPPSTFKMVCVETSVCPSVSSRSWPLHGAVFIIFTVSSNRPSRTGSASTSTVPSRERQLRTSAPTYFPAVVCQRLLLDAGGNRDRRAHRRLQSRRARGPTRRPPARRPPPRRGIVPRRPATRPRTPGVLQPFPDSLVRAGLKPAPTTVPAPRSAATFRSTTCRNRTFTSTVGFSPTTRHWVCISQGSLPSLGLAVGARVDAAEGPASLVLLGRAAVGPEHVALVEDGGGDLLYRVRQRSTSFSAVFSKLSNVLSQVNSALRDL